MPRETEFVKASEIVGQSDNRWDGVDELPHGRGQVLQVLNDSGILTICCEMGQITRDMHATIERYVR